MSTSKWTRTPWQHAESSFGRGNHFFSIVDKNLKRIAEVEASTQSRAVADGVRIISCVNTLEEIKNPEAIKELIEAAEGMLKYSPSGDAREKLVQALANLNKK